MKISIVIAFALMIITPETSCNTKTTIVRHTEAVDPSSTGFWKKETIWKPRWVKYWRAKTVQVPLWKKVWGPVLQNEWVPLPNSPQYGADDPQPARFTQTDWS